MSEPGDVCSTWPAVTTFIDSCLETATPEILIAHGVGLLAADRLRQTQREIPALLDQETAIATMIHLGAHSLLQRIRAVLDDHILLIKGPELAARYPSPTLRSFGDLDILVPDSARAKRILLDAGFREVDDYEFAHTERPLRWPGLPILIELHHRLPWLHWVSAPPASDYFTRAIPSATNIEGIETLPRPDHALLVAAHAWRHAPLRRLGDLIDITAMAEGLDPDELESRASRFGMGNVWRTSVTTRDILLTGHGRTNWPLRLWARHLSPPRERSVLEIHVARWIGALWAPTLATRLASVRTTAADDFGPLPGESWTSKLRRTRRALGEAAAPALLRDRNRDEP
jgi:hypothetical protein